MSDLTDLRKRASYMSSTGNYWAGKVCGLIDRVRVLEGIVARINDGWTYVLPAADLKAKRGLWWRVQDGTGEWIVPEGADRIPQEPMTPAERLAIYGDPTTGTDT
jgi:hypothetical protein